MPSQYEILLQHDGLLHKMPKDKLYQLQGELLQLFLVSDRHRGSTISEFAAFVLPAIHFNQFRIYRDDKKRPIGWINWAFMDDAEASGYMAGNFDFTIETWIGGKHLWFIDFIAPYGHILKIAEDMKTNVFPDRVGFAPDLEAKDGSKRVRKLFGVNMKNKSSNDDTLDFLKSITH